MELLVLFLFHFLLGAVCAAIASARGRSPVGWFFAGVFAPCVGLVILLCLPDVKQQQEERRKLIAENRLLRARLRELEGDPAAAAPDAFGEGGEAAEGSPGDAGQSWFYAVGGERFGPVDFGELRAAWSRREIRPDTLLWTAGMGGWARLDRIEGLLERLGS